VERREARRKSSAGTVKRFASTSRCSSNGQSSSSPTGSAVSLSRVAQTHSASSEQLAVLSFGADVVRFRSQAELTCCARGSLITCCWTGRACGGLRGIVQLA
jgi:hypothetical protein